MSTARTFGIDVSFWQGMIDWNVLKTSGVKFSFAKATDMQDRHDPTKTFKDPTFPNNYAGAKSIGALSGAFHFFREGYAGKDQADFFLAYYAPKRGDLLPAIDVETEARHPAQFVADLHDCVTEVAKAIGGKSPVIYTQKSVWDACGNPTGFEHCPLWVVDPHHPDQPVLPSRWPTYAFWQYQVNVVPPYHGIEKVDFNYFNGAVSAIGNLCY
jgi:lysozyme